ncbi:MAG: hypothetical protein RL367_1640 [Pseudomonadota bacterium]|jgi:hypothetical protein
MTKQSALPSVTRWAVMLTIGLILVASLALTILAGFLLFAWPEVVAEITKGHDVPPGLDVAAMQGVALAICLIGVSMALATGWALLQLRNIVDTVRDGDPFVQANALRLRRIGWVMVGIQVMTLPIGIMGHKLEHHFDNVNLGVGFPLNGLLAILLMFVLARVFEQGAAMRDDLEGTV